MLKKCLTLSLIILLVTPGPIYADEKVNDFSGNVFSSAPTIAPVALTAEQNAELLKNGKPKILIFWESIGFGHVSAANALKEKIQLANPGAEVVLKDMRQFQNPLIRKASTLWYDYSTKKNPDGYDRWYQNYLKEYADPAKVGQTGPGIHHKPDEVLKYIDEVKPTVIVSTQNHNTEALINLRDKGKLTNTPIAQVLTDYVDAPYFRALGDRVDVSFVPHESIREEWIRAGTSPSRVITTGIPVSPKVMEEFTPEMKPKALAAIDTSLKTDVQTVTLVSGSAGVGDFETMVKSMAEHAQGKPLQIVAVTARNEGHFKALTKLKNKLPANINLVVTGQLQNPVMVDLMKSSDVIVTKAGGLTSTELAGVGKPAILLDINGGQEVFNANLFQKLEMALSTKDQKNVGLLVRNLLDDPKLQSVFKENLAKLKGMIKPEKGAAWILAQKQVPYEEAKKLPARMWNPETSEFLNPNAVKAVDTNISEGAKSAQVAEAAPDAKKSGKALFLYKDEDVASARVHFMRKEAALPGNVKKKVLANYYLFDGNKTGGVFLAELREAARQGAETKLLVDGWGPERWVDAQLDPAMIESLKRDGVEVRVFNKVDLTKKTTYLKSANLNRSHNKTVILPGSGIVSQGDRNVQNVNFHIQNTNGQKGKGYRSGEMFIQNRQAVADAEAQFYAMWDDKSNGTFPAGATEKQIEQASKNLDRYLQVSRKGGTALGGTGKLASPFVEKDWTRKMIDVENVAYVADMPGSKSPTGGISKEILAAINSAEKNIRIVSPYLNLPPDFEKAVLAAHARGVKVELITASLETSDAGITIKMFEPQATALQKKGITVLQHTGPDFLHSKSIEIDGSTVILTSHNVNKRSTYTDFEAGIIIKDKELAKELKAFSDESISQSVKFTVSKKSPVGKCAHVFQRLLVKIPVLGRQL